MPTCIIVLHSTTNIIHYIHSLLILFEQMSVVQDNILQERHWNTSLCFIKINEGGITLKDLTKHQRPRQPSIISVFWGCFSQRGYRSCFSEQLPEASPMSNQANAAGSKIDLTLAQTETISDSGRASGLGIYKKEKSYYQETLEPEKEGGRR